VPARAEDAAALLARILRYYITSDVAQAAGSPLMRQRRCRLIGAPSPALARSWGGLCGVGHPGFVPLPAAVAPTITVMVPVRSADLSTQFSGSLQGLPERHWVRFVGHGGASRSHGSITPILWASSSRSTSTSTSEFCLVMAEREPAARSK
jgi:hypothetical protein